MMQFDEYWMNGNVKAGTIAPVCRKFNFYWGKQIRKLQLEQSCLLSRIGSDKLFQHYAMGILT